MAGKKSNSSKMRPKRQLLLEPARSYGSHDETSSSSWASSSSSSSSKPEAASSWRKEPKHQQRTPVAHFDGHDTMNVGGWRSSSRYANEHAQDNEVILSSQAHQSGGANNGGAAHHSQPSKRLSMLLVVLFGFLVALASLERSGSGATTLAGPQMTAAPSPSGAPMNASSIGLASPTSSSSGTPSAGVAALQQANATASSAGRNGDEAEPTDSSASEESVEEEAADGRPKLSALVTDTVGAAADQLVARLKSSEAASGSEEAAEAPGEAASSEDASETTDADVPEAKERSAEAEVATSGAPVSALPLSALHKPVRAQTGASQPATAHPASSEAQLELALDTYARWRAVSDDLIELFSRKFMPVLLEHGYEIDGSTVQGLVQVFNGIRGLKGWALKLVDASAKITPGLLAGTQADFGDYDECLAMRADDPAGLVAASGLPESFDAATGLPSSTLVGRYCLADVEFPKPPREVGPDGREAPIELRRPLFNFSQSTGFKETVFMETGNFFHMLYVDPIRVGLCLTNKIEPESFAKVINKVLEEFRVRIAFHGRCVTKYDRVEWTREQRISAWALLSVGALVALSTLAELAFDRLAKLRLAGPAAGCLKPVRGRRAAQWLVGQRALLTSFSLLRNTQRLFRTEAGDSCARPAFLASSHGGELPAGAKLATAGEHKASSADSSLDSSPSTERRSSAGTGSALNLIASSSGLEQTSGRSPGAARNKCSASSLILGRFAMLPAPASADQAPASPPSFQRQNGADLRSLHGVRVITMTWMIVNHTYLFGGFFVLWAHRRLIDIAEWPKSVSFQLVLNGWLTVETYFLLSAAIIVLNLMPRLRSRSFSYAGYVCHRLVRLLPAYAGLVMLNFLSPLVTSGPVWLVKGRAVVQEPCEHYLWTNFLFINNWYWPEKQCMVHTWFLSADFQLYLLAPVVVYLLYKRPVLGHSINIIVAIIGSIVSGFVIYANKLMPTTLINKLEFESIKQQLSHSYFATYQHLGPYCLGLFVGYLLHKRPHVRLPSHLNWTLWLLLPPLSFTTLLLTYLWNGAYPDQELINPSPLVSALYVAIHRTIWASLVAWLVFACATGQAKLLASFLGHPVFVPLSRLSYSIYLVHLPIILFRAFNLRHTIEWTDANILWEASGNLIASVILAYFLNVAFESPFINLERLLLLAGRSSRPERDESAADGSASAYQLQRAQQQLARPERYQRAGSELSLALKLKSDSAVEEEEEEAREEGDRTSVESSQTDSAHNGADTAERALQERVAGAARQPPRRPLGRPSEARASAAPPRYPASPPAPPTDDLYPISREYEHFARASGHHQARPLVAGANQAASGHHFQPSARPQQYATLARMSRLNYDQFYPAPSVHSLQQQPQQHPHPLQLQPPSHYQRPPPLVFPQKARIQQQQHRQPTTTTHQAAHRPHRYNTLSGGDWRRHYHSPLSSFDWLEGARLAANSGGQRQADAAPSQLAGPSAGWPLQAGALIPRIDSATLRRQANLQPGAKGNTIQEEEPDDNELDASDSFNDGDESASNEP